ncbi:TRAP transporter permease [Virgibacillus oceani]
MGEQAATKKIDTKVVEKQAYVEQIWDSRKEKWSKSRMLLTIISLLAIGLSIFHVYTAGFGTLSSWLHRSIHVLWAIMLIFLLFPFRKGKQFSFIDVIIILIAISTAGYMIIDAEGIQSRQGNISTVDAVFGTLFIGLVLDATRRTNGILMAGIGLFFLVYILFGQYFPGALAHPGIRYERMVDHMFSGTLGIFSEPIYVSSTVLILFVIFGAFLMRSGGGQFFTDFAFGLLGNKTGGPALSAVGSSSLVGTITGNGAANAAITGSFTIPLMKKLGYSKRFSASVEAVASQGGQIMPPIMGASVFIMAETLGIPYIQLAIYALIPAVIYFFIAGMVVYFHAKRLNMAGIPKEQLPSVRRVLLRQGYLFLPILLIIGLLLYGYSPMKAGFYGILFALVLSWIRKATRMKLLGVLAALENGARSALTVIAACATAGIIVGAVSLTGLGITFSRFVIDLAGGNLFLLLVFIGIASIIMGMGMPTVSAYVILAVLGAPALIQMGVNEVAAHMFVFYFGVMSGLTPPVAITAYTTAGIAGSDPFKTAAYAMKIGLGGFFVPFIFAYNPVLLMQGGDTVQITIAIVTAFLSCVFFAATLEDHLFGQLGPVIRLLMFIVAILLVTPGFAGDIIGIAMAIGLIIWQKRKNGNVIEEANQKIELER